MCLFGLLFVPHKLGVRGNVHVSHLYLFAATLHDDIIYKSKYIVIICQLQLQFETTLTTDNEQNFTSKYFH